MRLLLILTLASLAACARSASDERPASTPKEAWDGRSDPKLMSLTSRRLEELTAAPATLGALPKKPWHDSYWPYYRKSLAYRYADDLPELQSLEAQLASVDPVSLTLSPSEKYDLLSGDASFGLTRHSWDSYTSRYLQYGDDLNLWSWMGICNGWSAAALNEPAPIQNVVATAPDGRDVLFFAGDVRALASRAYDLNAMEGPTRLVGSRCDTRTEDVPKDAMGRPVDGNLMGVPFHVLHDFSPSSGAVLIATAEPTPRKLWLLLSQPKAVLDGEVDAYQYAARAEVSADVAARTLGARAQPGGPVKVSFYKACRDVNPATLHLALVDQVSDAAKEKKGFVIELNRDHEVWNHPVWGFQTTIGAPKWIAAEPQEMRALRAPSAVYAVPVTTRLVFVAGGLDGAPSYGAGDEDERIDWQQLQMNPQKYAYVDLRYTLELDQSGFVVGGEWRELTDRRVRLPDFFWRAQGAPTDRLRRGTGASPVKYSVVKNLLACSRGTPDTQVGGHVAVRCQL